MSPVPIAVLSLALFAPLKGGAPGPLPQSPDPLAPSTASSATWSANTTPGTVLRTPSIESSSQTWIEVESGLAGDSFGWIADTVGDVTGDGVPDIVSCAPLDATHASGAGMVAVYSGLDGRRIWRKRETVTSAVLGFSLEVADWNDDGTLDVFAGAPFSASGGRVYVYSGSNGKVLHTFDAASGQKFETFGSSVAVGGDFDGDGVDDVAIGSLGYKHSGLPMAGRVSVYSGVNAALITTIDGPFASAEFGVGMDFLGDVSVPADGRDELVIGHRDATFFGGSALVYAYDGVAPTLLYSVGGVGMGNNLIGDRIDAGGDLDGDGVGDFLVGDRTAEVVSVFSGADGALLHALTGNGEGGRFGTGSFTPDQDGDGFADLILGAGGNNLGAPEGGRLFLYSGREGVILRTMTYQTTLRRIGIEARWIGDHDGDGRDDFAFGGLGGSGVGPPLGRFLIVRGTELAQRYCTAGTSASGCRATLSGSGRASATADTGFDLAATGVEGDKDGIFFFGTSGRQASPWGDGSSFQCVVPPVKRSAPLAGGGTPGGCDGWFLLDLHAHWTARPAHNPGAGAVAQAQLWYRDPFSTSNQTTSLSDAVEFPVGP
jgi:hypothetical protein